MPGCMMETLLGYGKWTKEGDMDVDGDQVSAF